MSDPTKVLQKLSYIFYPSACFSVKIFPSWYAYGLCMQFILSQSTFVSPGAWPVMASFSLFIP